MKTYKAVIVDDEEMSVSALEQEVNHFVNQIEIVGSALTIPDAVKLINLKKPDILFLDIRLSDGLGFEILDKLEFSEFKLIFTTAYGNYAIEAFKVEAFDYLLKPVSAADINQAINRLNKKPESGANSMAVNNNKLAIHSSGESVYISIDEITHCSSMGNYTTLYFQDHKKILAPKTLKDISDKLINYGFLRVHKSHLINMTHVSRFRSKELKIILKDGTEIPVSHRKKSSLNNYFESM